MIRDGTITPERCVRCNAAASGGFLRVALPPPIYAEGGVFWSLPAVVQFFSRETVHAELAPCPSCQRRRARWMRIAGAAVWLFGLAFAAGVGGLVAVHFHAVDRNFGAIAIYCFPGGAVGLLLSLTRRSRLRSVLRVHQVEGGLAWTSEASREFLGGVTKID